MPDYPSYVRHKKPIFPPDYPHLIVTCGACERIYVVRETESINCSCPHCGVKGPTLEELEEEDSDD